MTFDAAARGVQGAGARPDRRRLRPAAARDDRRHAERQGGHRRDRGGVRGEGRAPAADDLGHDHRSQRPHAVGPDDRRVLGLDRARQAVQRRHQLRARRARHAAVRRGARAASPTATSAAIRTPGCRTRSASTTSSPTDTAGALREFADERLRQHRRRLLRHDARSHPRDRATAVEGLPPRPHGDRRVDGRLATSRLHAVRRPRRRSRSGPTATSR